MCLIALDVKSHRLVIQYQTSVSCRVLFALLCLLASQALKVSRAKRSTLTKPRSMTFRYALQLFQGISA